MVLGGVMGRYSRNLKRSFLEHPIFEYFFVYKIIKYKTNYLYSIGDYTVINGIIQAALS